MPFGMIVDDVDSLEAYADALERNGIFESYGNYCARMAAERDAELGIDPDAYSECDDFDPEPPTPAAPAIILPVPSAPCTLCRGFGCVAMVPRTESSGRPCWLCGGTGEDPYPAEAPAPPVNDRTERMRRLGQSGGMTTFLRYGSNHYRVIGKAGYAATVKAHGAEYARSLLLAKGWQPRKPDLLSDLAAGRLLAELDAAA
jgi:hypothetical protein